MSRPADKFLMKNVTPSEVLSFQMSLLRLLAETPPRETMVLEQLRQEAEHLVSVPRSSSL